MKNIFVLIVLFSSIQACTNKNREDLQFFANGDLSHKKIFNDKDSLIYTLKYYKRVPDKVFKKTINKANFDSVYVYYDNGNLFKKGIQTRKGKIFGVWNYYDREENLREIREWFIVDDTVKINRAWFLNTKGDTLAWRSEDTIFRQKEFQFDTLGFRHTTYNKIRFLTKDTIAISEYYFAFADCGSPILRAHNSKVKVVVDNTNSLNSDFSNAKAVKFDTFYHAKIDTLHAVDFPGYDLEKVAAFSGRFKTPGTKTVRGYMIEYTDEYTDENVEGIHAESKTYFEKVIYVKDSVE